MTSPFYFTFQPAYMDGNCQRIHRSRGTDPCEACDLSDAECRGVGCTRVDDEEPDTDEEPES